MIVRLLLMYRWSTANSNYLLPFDFSCRLVLWLRSHSSSKMPDDDEEEGEEKKETEDEKRVMMTNKTAHG